MGYAGSKLYRHLDATGAKEGDPLGQIRLANEIAKFGLAEARRSILSLRSTAAEQSFGPLEVNF
jgi:hypothetical protein